MILKLEEFHSETADLKGGRVLLKAATVSQSRGNGNANEFLCKGQIYLRGLSLVSTFSFFNKYLGARLLAISESLTPSHAKVFLVFCIRGRRDPMPDK